MCRGEDKDAAKPPSLQFPSTDARQFLYSDGMRRQGSRDATHLHRRHSRCAPSLCLWPARPLTYCIYTCNRSLGGQHMQAQPALQELKAPSILHTGPSLLPGK